MNQPPQPNRREFIKTTGRFAAISALAGTAIPHVYGAETNTIQIALIGCGGRGGGAASNALSVKQCPMKLVAMADVFENRLASTYSALSQQHGKSVDVPPDRRFIGFDGYQKAMDCLKPGDIAIFTTPLAFRWVHFTYAIQKGLHVFMEKPLTADGPSSRRMLKLADDASAKNLKVGVGLMSRHSRPMQELQKRIQDGEIGEINLMRGYRMAGPLASAFSEKWPGQPSELLWQISRFHSFIWASGGCYNDFYIHHIDHLCWMKNAWPIKAQALGGRHYRHSRAGDLYVDQNFDTYSVEYTFADGAKLYLDGRCMLGCNDIYSSYAHGSKGMAVVSKYADCGMPSSTHSGQAPLSNNTIWTSKVKPAEEDPYLNEWNDLVEAILHDKPYSEVKRGVQASVTCSLGRKAAHTGKEITYDEMLNSDIELAPGVAKLTLNSPPPVASDAEGRYPVPQPGIVTDREY
ncbi:MAG TPA: gfo/Idh/MocA family oxidoreductase [Verrucomicrobiae bacterium]|jgi:predicted dehydrogenase|nr:gfo/Idh/MocA family oxidoreductase [Verrucomicrobiae bacterium]